MCDEGAKPANWEKWAQLIDVEVWEAVALSFGAEPETIRGLNLDWRDDDPFEDCQDDFRLKLKIACNHIESGALRAKWARKTPFRKVKLVDFSEWACAPPRNWLLPKQFPRNPQDERAGDGNATQALPAPSTPNKSAALTRSEPEAPDTADQRELPERPDGVSDSAWRNFCDAMALVPAFDKTHGGISRAARAVEKEKERGFSAVRRDLQRVLRELRSVV